jgi:polar amino acid transport system substrate-binding protein
MKHVLMIAAIAALVFHAGEGRAWAGDRRIVVAKAEIDYPPYQFEKAGRPAGVCAEIIALAARELSLTIVYRQYPWKRMLYYAEKGRVDAVMPLFKTAERQTFLAFPENELVFEENVLFVHRDSSFRYDGDLMRLRDHHIGLVQNYSYGAAFDRVKDLLTKDVSINDKMLVDKFKRGRFQIGVGNRHVIGYYARQLGCASEIRFLRPDVAREPLYIGFSKAKGHEPLAAGFSLALEEVRKTDAYRQLLRKYGFH